MRAHLRRTLLPLIYLALCYPSAAHAQAIRDVEVGAYAGWHNFGCGGQIACVDLRRLGLGAIAGAEVQLSRVIALGVESSLWQHRENTAHRTQLHIVLSATLAPAARTGPYLKGGLGYGWLKLSLPDNPTEPPLTWQGLGWSTSVGYRLAFGGRSWVAPFLGVSSVPYDDAYRASLIQAGLVFGRAMGAL